MALRLLHLQKLPILPHVPQRRVLEDFLDGLGVFYTMRPGGYKFGDYWRMGLPLEILVVLMGVLMILLVWPL